MPAQWQQLPRADKVDLLAYDRWRQRRRAEYRKAINKDDPSRTINYVRLAIEEL